MSLTRRHAALSFGALWTALAVPAGALAQPARVLSWTPKALTAAEAATLVAAVDTIIPATDTPGAVEAGVPQFIDRTLAAWSDPADAARLRTGLADLDARARKAGGAAFAALAPAQRTAVLQAVEADAGDRRPHYFPMLRELTTVGYFTSEAGATKALRYDPVPGDFRGCVPLKEIGRAWAL